MSFADIAIRKIKMLREINNYTQQYVADELDISQNAYSLIEKGLTKLTLERLEQIAGFYQIGLADFLTETPMQGAAPPASPSAHTNFPPAISALEKNLYEKTIAHLENNINHLYQLIEQLTRSPMGSRKEPPTSDMPQPHTISRIHNP